MSNTGIIRQLKKKVKPTKKFKKGSENGISLLLSLIAIIFSGLSIYFQFFYKTYDLRINFIAADFDDKSNLIYNILYDNKSNQDATILRNTIVFYQDSSDIDNKSIYFDKSKAVQTFNEDFDPVVLDENKQIYREIKQPKNFENILDRNKINFKDTIRISLAVGFINEFGNYSTNYIPMGWVKLDSLNQPLYYSFNYLSQNLISKSYRSSTSRTEK